jgi:tripartite-type tricarboxylate transporter receptor subunit TctC
MSEKIKPSEGLLPPIRRRTFMAGAAATTFAAPFVWTRGAHAAGYPDRTITAVVMYAAGGGTDVMIRVLTDEIKQATGWDINVINKPGAVGGVATNFLLNKPSDGYWWLGAANYNKFVRVMGHADSKAWEDWQYFQGGNSLASWSVPVDSPFKTFDDVVAAAKKNPGKVSISTSGTGGLWQELALIVANAAGIELKFVPYKGGKPATLAGLQGEVDVAGGGVHEHIDFIRAGKLRNLQQTGKTDIEVAGYGTLPSVGNFLPEVKPLLPLSGIYNIALRRDTPVEILKEVEQAWIKACDGKNFKDVVKSKHFEIDVRTGEEADRRAALVETVTAATFWANQDKIGKQVRSPEELGLPKPQDFDKWWPPAGYKPRLTMS